MIIWDRFGALPTSVKNLLKIVRVKILGTELGITSVKADNKSVKLLGVVSPQVFYKVQSQNSKTLGQWSWSQEGLVLPKGRLLPDEQLEAAEKVLQALVL
jgi:transcription-repair coupling factor (superfamily II helicase)